MKKKILFLEDDTLFSETISDFLEDEGFLIDIAYDGEEAIEKSFKNRYDLFLLDINVPMVNGLDFLKEIRNSGDMTPTIFLTSYQDKETLLKGFSVGCDDFLRKPVDIDELLLRINALINRYGKKEYPISDTISFDFEKRRVLKNGIDLNLSPKIALLLELLILNENSIITKEEINDYIYNSSDNISEGAIRVYINKLKKIIGEERIKNIRGVGYKFEK